MPARSLLRLVYRALPLGGAVVYAGCAGAGPGNVAAPPPRPGSLITQEAIAASGAKTAWDALKRTVPYVQLLDPIPASDIVTIELLSGLEATTRYGATSTAGLIIIRTKTGSQ